MRCILTFVCGALILTLTPPIASAQVVASTFDQLRSGVKPGERIFVIDTTGVQTDGTLKALSPEVLTIALKGHGERRFTRDDVIAVRRLGHDPVWNGAAIGAGATSAFVLVSVGLQCGRECGKYLPEALVGAAVWGAGIGALIDACILTPQDVYRRGPAVQVRVAPQLGRDRVGAAVTLRW
jgi:hypothetical protein